MRFLNPLQQDWILGLALSFLWPLAAMAEAIDVGDRLELMVDDFLCESMENVRYHLHSPVDRGEVMRFDQPWEGAFSGYGSMVQESERILFYYRGLPKAGQDGSVAEVTCVAESRDGIHWNKPPLGLYSTSDGSENNIILSNKAPFSHNFSPFLDRNPSAKGFRFKALAGIASSGLMAFGSRDGLEWEALSESPVFSPEGWVLDSQNVAFWSPHESRYLCYYRSSVDGIRSIARASSVDFLDWKAEGQMRFSDTDSIRPSQHLYTNQTQPYFRAPHIYVATPARFFPGRKVLSDEEARLIDVHPKYYNDTSDAALMTSRGGLLYQRFHLEALLRPGIGANNWVSRSNYPVLGWVQTSPHEMSFYTNQDYGQPTAHLHRYVFRLDGLSSVRAGDHPGIWVSKPLVRSGNHLFLNASTSASGFLRIELMDEDGEPIEGYAGDHAMEWIGNEVQRPYRWKRGPMIELDEERPIRMKIHLKDADLFALRFGRRNS